MALEGTIKTPIGNVQKKTAVLLGGCVVVLGVIVYYRQKQLGGGTADVSEDAPINPATGYPYGSAEDAAALADQASYISPPASSGGGGSSVPASNVGYTSNGEWTQAAISYLTNNGAVEDATQLSAALGKYITGAYADATQTGLIQQAIAAVGYPPIAGTTGYPPSINKTPPTDPANPVPNNVTEVTGLHVQSATTNSVTVAWTYKDLKPDYQQVILNGVPTGKNLYGTYTIYQFTGLKPKTKYNFQILGYKNATPGKPAIVQGSTK